VRRFEMATDPEMLRINPGEIGGWPILRIEYPTDPERIAALLPPGIEPADSSNVHLSIYNVPVADEPEYGVVVKVDASYRGVKGGYAVAYGIDQESAVYISKETNGQPKFLAEIEYFRHGDNVRARCSHHGYTFLEFKGKCFPGLGKHFHPFLGHLVSLDGFVGFFLMEVKGGIGEPPV
jgi:hypothetical protein